MIRGARSDMENTLTQQSSEIGTAMKAVDPIRQHLDRMHAVIGELTISNPETEVKGAEMVGWVTKSKKALEKSRKELVGPLNIRVDQVNAVFKEVTQELDEGKKKLEQKIIERRREVEAEATRIRERAEAEAEKKRQEARELGMATPTPEPVFTPAPPQNIKTNLGTVSIRKTWTFEVTDFKLLPDKYKTTNDVFINDQIVKGKVREIPGLRIYQKESVSSR